MTNRYELIAKDYSKFKADWQNRSVCYRLSRLAMYYPLHWFRLTYWYYFDSNSYTSYKAFVNFIQKQDK